MQRFFWYNRDMDNLWNYGATQIYKALDGQVRLVGGCIRDYLCRRPIHDRDMATPLTPDVVCQKLDAAQIPYLTIGQAHGTISAKFDKDVYEITTLRKDDKTDGRHAIVSWTTSYKTDALRRDFTVNAFSADIKNKIFDYTTGRSDLAQGLIRFIGDPETRIQEDYLRILRYFRFWSAISPLPIDMNIVALCTKHKKGLEQLSKDRIRDELFRILETNRATEVLSIMKKAGLFTKAITSIPFSKKQLNQIQGKPIEKQLIKLGFQVKGE